MAQWVSFINAVYNGRQDNKQVKRVFESLDNRDIGYMVMIVLINFF